MLSKNPFARRKGAAHRMSVPRAATQAARSAPDGVAATAAGGGGAGASATATPTKSSASPSRAASTSATKRKTARGSGGAAAAASSAPSAALPAAKPKKKRSLKTLVKTMELMREACQPYDTSPSAWKLRVGESFLLNPQPDNKADEMVYRDELNRPLKGHIYVTTFQLRFYPTQHVKIAASFFRVPLGTIEQIVVQDDTSMNATAYSSANIILRCKDHRTLRFTGQRHKVLQLNELLKAFVFPSKIDFTFAFQVETELEKLRSKGSHELVQSVEKHRGKGPRYDFYEEFTRCGALSGDGLGDTELWRASQLNNTYEFAPTYPALNIMPAQFSDAELRSLGGFRSKCRVPSMSWCMPGTDGRGPTLWRCSQPKVGMQSKRNVYDEKLLRWIARNNAEYVKKPGQHCLLVGDARPQLNAYTNKVGGWGYEEASAYPFIELRFLNIDNIHKVRGALKKLSDTVMSGKTSVAELTNWFKTVEDTKWLFLVRTLLYGSIQCAYEMLKNRRSCLVHCSDGWDRTAQLSSLVQILLDPFARTIDGFCIVIQKDWLSFGHQFQKRVGHGHPEHDDSQRSPVFIQFLDATWQLLNQYPEVFEFNSDLLMTIADELYSCQFGTFLFNTEAQRKRASLDRKTLSLWDHVEEHRARFTNPRYLGDDAPFMPNSQLCLKNVVIWQDYHMRWGPRPNLPSWNFFDTRRFPPPFTWPSSDKVSLAHSRRALSAAVAAKTGPLQSQVHQLKALLKKARQEIATLKAAAKSAGATDIAEDDDAAVAEIDAALQSAEFRSPRPSSKSKKASEEVVEDAAEGVDATERIVAEDNSGDADVANSAQDVEEDDDGEDWVALAETGGAPVAAGEDIPSDIVLPSATDDEEDAEDGAKGGAEALLAAEAEAKAVAAPGKAPFSRTTSVPELDEGDLVVIDAAAETEANGSAESGGDSKSTSEIVVDDAVVVEEAVGAGGDNLDDNDDGLDGVEVEMSEEEDDDAAMDML